MTKYPALPADSNNGLDTIHALGNMLDMYDIVPGSEFEDNPSEVTEFGYILLAELLGMHLNYKDVGTKNVSRAAVKRVLDRVVNRALEGPIIK